MISYKVYKERIKRLEECDFLNDVWLSHVPNENISYYVKMIANDIYLYLLYQEALNAYSKDQ